MGFALSTSWNAFRCRSGKKLIFEIEQLGFKEVELSFNLTGRMVRDIAGIVKAGKVHVVSVHNYCPVPDSLSRKIALPDYYSLASLDEAQRKLAVKYTKQSIDAAVRLHARAVVLHCGRVEISDRTRVLIALYEQGQKKSRKFLRLKDSVVKERRSACPSYFVRTLESLEELNRYARKAKVSLGIETRFYYREIPSLEEMQKIFLEFKGGNIFYWHDTGHAQVRENLGFCRQRDYLELCGRQMLGVHLHGVTGCTDHLAPLEGEISLRWLKPYLKEATLKVIEAHSPTSARDLVASRIFLERQLHAGKCA